MSKVSEAAHRLSEVLMVPARQERRRHAAPRLSLVWIRIWAERRLAPGGMPAGDGPVMQFGLDRHAGTSQLLFRSI